MKRPASATKMKKLKEKDGFDIYELGDLLYFFHPKEKTDRVIISAHGGHAVLSRTNQFTVPSDTVLRFYSTDTKSVLDPGFSNFYEAEAAPKEIIGEGERSFDYLLSKYQGRHGNKSETYDSIASTINSTVKSKASMTALAAKATNSSKQAELLNTAARKKVAAVLTIRNRWFKGEATLSMVVDAVKTQAPEVLIFDCLFCRSTMFGGSDAVPLISRVPTKG